MATSRQNITFEYRDSDTPDASLRELIDAIGALWGDPEDCEDCGDIGERPCQLHESSRLFAAVLRAEEVLGPCECGHHRRDHGDCDTTACCDCECRGFRLAKVQP